MTQDEPGSPIEKNEKDRSRKKQLFQAIRKQMEFYFSGPNLARDRFMSKLLQENDCIDLSLFLKFNKIRAMTNDLNTLARALRKSEVIEVTDDMKIQLKKKIQQKEDPDECTIYVEHVPPDADHDWLQSIFSSFGKVDYLSIPRFHNGRCKGFAFVEFDTPETTKSVLEEFKRLGYYMPHDIPPHELLSVVVYNQEKKVDTKEGVKETCEVEKKETSQKKGSKRKIPSGESEIPEEAKKPKIESQEKSSESQDPAQGIVSGDNSENNSVDGTVEIKKKKNRKKKKKPKKIDATSAISGFQFLSKKDWKKLRNQYLNAQRQKMVLLKKHLVQNKWKNGPSTTKPKEPDATKPDFGEVSVIPGSVVKLEYQSPIIDVKAFQKELKVNPNVSYVDLKEGATVVHVRFKSGESAADFCSSSLTPASVLEGDEEREYAEVIKRNRDLKFNSKKNKERGKDKLIRKAEQTLGKHIIFDEI